MEIGPWMSKPLLRRALLAEVELLDRAVDHLGQVDRRFAFACRISQSMAISLLARSARSASPVAAGANGRGTRCASSPASPGPGLPVADLRRSTFTTLMISAAVPVRNTSSAV